MKIICCLNHESNYSKDNCNWMLIDLNSLKHNLYKYKNPSLLNYIGKLGFDYVVNVDLSLTKSHNWAIIMNFIVHFFSFLKIFICFHF